MAPSLTMKLLLLIFVSLIFINKAVSQKQSKGYGNTEIKFEIGSKRKITKVDVEGNFSDADTAFIERLKRRLSASTFKRAKKGTYTVKISFIVDRDGNVSDVECIKDPGYGMCAESVRAVKASSKWVVPEGGIPVRPAKSPSNKPRLRDTISTLD